MQEVVAVIRRKRRCGEEKKNENEKERENVADIESSEKGGKCLQSLGRRWNSMGNEKCKIM